MRQHRLNKARGGITGGISVSSAFLGADGISVNQTDDAASYLSGMVAPVVALEAYVGVEIVINLLKTRSLVNQFRDKLKNNAYLGDVRFIPDSDSDQGASFEYCTVAAISNERINGGQPTVDVVIKGVMMTNSEAIGSRAGFQAMYQHSPIIMTGGAASLVPGGMVPISALTGIGSVMSGGDLPSFEPVAGSTLINYEAATYPLANQITAANAILKQPLTISLLMKWPSSMLLAKMPVFTGLKAALDYHAQSGGLFHIMTPAYIYKNCLLVKMTDESGGDSRQPQHAYQFDFIQPLITEEDAIEYGDALGKSSSGLPVAQDASWSGLGSAVGGAFGV